VTSPADATLDQRGKYEETCLRCLRAILDRQGHDLFNGRQVTATALRGEYPETEIVITFTEKTGQLGTVAFDLWRDDPPGNVTDPQEADMSAGIIWANVAGM
jgi:hypothetical protein